MQSIFALGYHDATTTAAPQVLTKQLDILSVAAPDEVLLLGEAYVLRLDDTVAPVVSDLNDLATDLGRTVAVQLRGCLADTPVRKSPHLALDRSPVYVLVAGGHSGWRLPVAGKVGVAGKAVAVPV
jgi:hypothetical protein